jgi:hypothetical protein
VRPFFWRLLAGRGAAHAGKPSTANDLDADLVTRSKVVVHIHAGVVAGEVGGRDVRVVLGYSEHAPVRGARAMGQAPHLEAAPQVTDPPRAVRAYVAHERHAPRGERRHFDRTIHLALPDQPAVVMSAVLANRPRRLTIHQRRIYLRDTSRKPRGTDTLDTCHPRA